MTEPQRDAETLVAWVREAADELEKAHAFLDGRGVPRSIPGNEPVECTLAARVRLLDMDVRIGEDTVVLDRNVRLTDEEVGRLTMLADASAESGHRGEFHDADTPCPVCDLVELARAIAGRAGQ